MNYLTTIKEFMAIPAHRLAAVRSHRAYLRWQADQDSRELRRKFQKVFSELPVEF